MMTYEQVKEKWHDFPGTILPCFISGVLSFVRNKPDQLYENRDLIYHTKFIMSDGIPYNLHDADSVRSIQVPKNNEIQLDPEYAGMGITGYLYYVLEIKAGSLRDYGQHELSIILLEKAQEIAEHVGFIYPKNECEKLVNWLLEDGRFDEARNVHDEFQRKYSPSKPAIGPFFHNYLAAWSFKNVMDFAQENHHKYLISDNQVFSLCSECAKYRNRTYSIYGDDTRFPRLPTYECSCQGLGFRVSFFSPTEDEIRNSNRPYIDDRTDEEKANYQHFLDSLVYDEMKYKDRTFYYKLLYSSVKGTPKSFGAFRRMKNGNTANFLKLSENAAVIGLDITMSTEEREVFERYRAYCKEHNDKL